MAAQAVWLGGLAQGAFDPPTRKTTAMTGAADTFIAAARAASISPSASEARRALIPIMGTEALICYRFDHGEHTRRQLAGTGPICSSDVLELLLGLPIAMPVPVESLTQRERTALAVAPPGSVSVSDGLVTRHAVTPVTVDLALVAARCWRKGLEVAGRFAPFCVRGTVLRRRPRDLSELQAQGGFYGVGAILVEQQSAEVLVTPAPFCRRRFTAAGWRFLEEVYRRVR